MAFDFPGVSFDLLEEDGPLESPLAHQGAWNRLHGYSIKHRLGGVIEGARAWGVNAWIARCGLGAEWLEIMDEESTLWEWRGDDLHILYYNHEQDGRNASTSKARSEAGKKSGESRRKSPPKTLSNRVLTAEGPKTANDSKQTTTNTCSTSVERDEMRRDETRRISSQSNPSPTPEDGPPGGGRPGSGSGTTGSKALERENLPEPENLEAPVTRPFLIRESDGTAKRQPLDWLDLRDIWSRLPTWVPIASAAELGDELDRYAEAVNRSKKAAPENVIEAALEWIKNQHNQ